MSAEFIALVVLAGVANAEFYYGCQFRVKITDYSLIINAQCVDEKDSVNNCSIINMFYIFTMQLQVLSLQ